METTDKTAYLNFKDAVKTVADLNKALSRLGSIGINLEGGPDNGVGSDVWSAITQATNIVLRSLGYEPGDEKANSTLVEFIDQHTDDLTDADIERFYKDNLNR